MGSEINVMMNVFTLLISHSTAPRLLKVELNIIKIRGKNVIPMYYCTLIRLFRKSEEEREKKNEKYTLNLARFFVVNRLMFCVGETKSPAKKMYDRR